MALAAGKVEDVEEAEAALLAAHGRKPVQKRVPVIARHGGLDACPCA